MFNLKCWYSNEGTSRIVSRVKCCINYFLRGPGLIIISLKILAADITVLKLYQEHRQHVK